MKQLKKLTRHHRTVLKEAGITDIENIRFSMETRDSYVFYDISNNEELVVSK